jgi:hypothetical protein
MTKTKQETLLGNTSVEVVNLRTCKDFGTREGDVLIDRRTKWGNPYKISKTCSREESIQQYEFHFVFKLLIDLREIKGARRLGCWCKPLACHGDVIKRYLEKI